MTKKISLIIISVICVVIIATISILGFAKTSYKPDFSNPDIIRFSDKNTYFESYLNNSEDNSYANYEKVLDMVNDSFKESKFNSIFSGRSSFNSTIELAQKAPTFSGYIIELIYNADNIQTLTKDGKTYYYNTNSTKQINYDKIIIEITNSDELAINKVWFVEEEDSELFYYGQNCLCNFSNVYDYFEDRI